MRRIRWWFCVILCLCLLAGPFKAEAAQLAVSAKSAVLIEAGSGMVLFEKNAQEKMPMASTTKIMSALITLEQKEIDQEFRVDNKAIMVEGTSMGLSFDDTVTLRTLACGMLLSSGNDAANAAAVEIAGSVDKFATLMNKRALELGMVDTNFVTPSGLDSKGHQSTAFDMALLAREALGNADFAQICALKSCRVSFGNPPVERTLYNHNKLLSLYDGTIGIKTGFTKKAGRCLVSAATRDGITLICVTLNAPDDWNDHMRLFDYGFENTERISLEGHYKPVLVPVTGSERRQVKAVVQNDNFAAAVKGEEKEIETSVFLPKFVYAPVKTGDILGNVCYSLNGKIVASCNLVAGEDAPLKRTEDRGLLDKLWSWLDRFF